MFKVWVANVGWIEFQVSNLLSRLAGGQVVRR